jgi:hypothetical protein
LQLDENIRTETKVTGSKPVASNRERGQGSSWAVEEEDEEKVV